eukprot:COSAG06_NODE_586_length_14002_cov_11.579228_11_plen_794_part_00
MPKYPGVSRPASPDADDVGLRAPPNDLLPERSGDALRPAEPGSGEEVTASPLVGFLEGRASRGSGRLSVLDLAAADLADAEDSRLQNESTQSCALCAWAGNAVVYGAGCAAIWYALFWLYFHETISDEGMCDSAAQIQTRATIHWLVGLLPTLGRTVLFGVAMFVASVLCQTAGLVPEGTGRSLAPVLLLGAGPTDGSAKNAGWLAIVGDERRTQQTTWEQAMQARGLTAPQAWTVASVKLLFWHWSQPLAYLLLLMSYRCYIAELGPTQENMAVIVATREVLYLCSTLLAVATCPVFLLLDVRTMWNEAETLLQRFTWTAMYVLCPHNFVALALSNRFRRWVRFFLVLAAVQVMADVASCYALANLLASRIQAQAGTANSTEFPTGDEGVDIVPLEIGYSITAFGFLLFFGPLSILSSFAGVLDTQRHMALRLAKGLAGLLLLSVWVCIMVLMGWLVAGGNPFCSGLPFLADPCSGHGACHGAAGCFCEEGWGPDSKVSGTALCSCQVGFIDGSEGTCSHETGCDGAGANDDYCGPHGDCFAIGGEHSCICSTGWSGNDCDRPTGCDSNPCGVHAERCVANGGTHSCVCKSGWAGTTSCNSPTGCVGNPCNHGGTCSAIGGEHRCTCTAHWNGTECDTCAGGFGGAQCDINCTQIGCFEISGATGAHHVNGIYVPTGHVCGKKTDSKPVYQRDGVNSDLVLYRHPGTSGVASKPDIWLVGPHDRIADCSGSREESYLFDGKGTNDKGCPDSPVDCVRSWKERDVAGCAHPDIHKYCVAPGVVVRRVGASQSH